MVNYRSEISRSRTGIHGGVRRGSAAAAIGAVLVLSAGVSASQADGGTGSDEPDVQITGSTQLPAIGGLVQGLLGDTVPTSPQPTPVPEATPVSPSPTTTVQTSPAPAPATDGVATGAATPATATAPLPAGTAVPLQQPAAGQPETGAAPSGAAAGVSVASGMDAPAADQPAVAPDGPTPPSASAPGATAASRMRVPQAVGGAGRSSQELTAAAEQAEPTAEAAKVWLGVGLVGTAGAAGFVFTRIRQF